MSARIEVIGGPWRERVGQRGWIVEDPRDGIYPFKGKGADEAIIVLDNDPLRNECDEPQLSNGQRWTCAILLKDIKQIGGSL